MNPRQNSFSEPLPRLSLGVALLLWGAYTEHPIIGLLLAIVAEAHNWTKTRWNFGEVALQRAWRLCMLLLTIVVVSIWLNSTIPNAYTAPRTMVWLPLISLPLLFVQNYGLRPLLPLTSFSHILAKQRLHARRYGLPFRERYFHFAPLYFLFTLIASSLGANSRHPTFYPALVLLCLIALRDRFRWRPRHAPIAATFLSLLAIGIGYFGAEKLQTAYTRLALGHGYKGHSGVEWSQHRYTGIGGLGRQKQSHQILWRLLPKSGALPELVRTASYNRFHSSYWSATRIKKEGDDEQGEFIDLNTYEQNEINYHIVGRDEAGDFLEGAIAGDLSLPGYRLRGRTPNRILLPLPHNAASLITEEEHLESNRFGAVRLRPTHGVIDALTLWGLDGDTAVPPFALPEHSLKIPQRSDQKSKLRASANTANQEAIKRFVDRLGLRSEPLPIQIRKLQSEFLRNFRYARYSSLPDVRSSAPDFIHQFLEETHRGHCEYYATVSALALRECGIPTRYATGFAVKEFDRKGNALLRGTHAHAWALAWDEQGKRWIDVDLTPPDWLNVETPRQPKWQSVIDYWQTIIVDFTAWRSHPKNLNILLAFSSLPLIAGSIFVLIRLWKSRRELSVGQRVSYLLPDSPLLSLEKQAGKILAPRPDSLSLAQWLTPLAEKINHPEKLFQALRLHQKLCYDPSAQQEGLRQDLLPLVSDLKKEFQQLRKEGK